MKNTYKILLISILLISILEIAKAQTCILDMSDTFGQTDCIYHCWARTSKNVISYFGNSTLSNESIIDYARREGYLFDFHGCLDFMCADCYITPDTCCKTIDKSYVGNIIENFIPSILTIGHWEKNSIVLYNQFILGKPAIINVTGHTFVAYGISGNSVYVLDGGLSAIRPIDDICPGRTWTNSLLFTNYPDCSYNNYLSNSIKIGRIFKASHSIITSNTIFNHPGNASFLKAEDNIQVNNNTLITLGTSIHFQTGQNICP